METTICKQCKTDKELNSSNFKPEKRTKLGFDSTCRECRCKRNSEIRANNPERFKEIDRKARESERYKQYQVNYQTENKDSLKSSNKERYYNDKEPYLKRSKEQKIRLGDEYKQYQKEYKLRNRKRLSQQYLEKLKTDPVFKLKHTLRNQFRKLIKGFHKQNSVLTYVGCDVESLKTWLSDQFREGMTWENHGSVWHVDHIIPCSVFDFSDEDELSKCWNYTNLRPLFAEENLSKSDRLDNSRGRDFPSYKQFKING